MQSLVLLTLLDALEREKLEASGGSLPGTYVVGKNLDAVSGPRLQQGIFAREL